MRTIQSARAVRFFCLRCRYAKAPARRTVSAAVRYSLRRPPTKPFACLRIFLRRRRVFGPPFARGICPLLLLFYLQVGDQHLQPRVVRPVDELLLAQAAPPLRRLTLELVLLPAARPHQLARRRALQPLARAALRLHLRHVVRLPVIEERHGSAGALRTYGGYGGHVGAPISNVEPSGSA